jgi:hypothetical protein
MQKNCVGQVLQIRLGMTRASKFDPLRVSSWMIPWLETKLSILTCVKTACENQFEILKTNWQWTFEIETLV